MVAVRSTISINTRPPGYMIPLSRWQWNSVQSAEDHPGCQHQNVSPLRRRDPRARFLTESFSARSASLSERCCVGDMGVGGLPWLLTPDYRLLVLIRAGGDRLRRRFGGAQVAADLVLLHRPHHDLVEIVLAAGIKLDGLVHIAVLLFDHPVIGTHIEGEAAVLFIGLLELQANGGDGGEVLALV